MISQIDLQNEFKTLPPNMQKEVWDFIQFVKTRHGLPATQKKDSSTTDSHDSSLYQALEQIGFVGCIATGDQLSQTYKSRLDFSNNCGDN